MKTTDIELINRILDGDDTAFTELVQRYQKPVHALVWRKIGDFHIAEEITQDTFLKAYHGLAKLKKPQSFASWLYVIAANNCSTWLRKNRAVMHPLEDTNNSHVKNETYSQHLIDENERITAETQREVVKKLLAKLPESERTVITLHYFGEMSSSQIGTFLGVSANTIRSRLRRARKLLQKEENMIREALEHFQISPNLTESVINEITHQKPAPTVSKPIIPWVITATSTILSVLLLGISSQYYARFQKPYDLDAQTEMTVELVDTPTFLNLEARSEESANVRNANALNKSENIGQNSNETTFANPQIEGEDPPANKQRWFRAKPTTGTLVEGLLSTSKGELYTLADRNLYKLENLQSRWKHVADLNTITDVPLIDIPMAEFEDTLYMIPSNKLYASNDDGKTWNIYHEFPEEYQSPKQLMLTKQAFYTVFERTGAFRSVDKGKTWQNINDEFPQNPNYIVEVNDTVFALAGKIYRRSSDSWQSVAKFPVLEAKSCFSITATQDKLYAIGISANYDPNVVAEAQRSWWIFRTTDFGKSWKDITPTHVWKEKLGWAMDIHLIAVRENLMAFSTGMVRSTDAGNTWMPLQAPHISPSMFSNSPAATLSEQVLYFGSWDYGLQRSFDGGQSWDMVDVNSGRSAIGNLIVMKENKSTTHMPLTIYGSTIYMVKTADKGKSWATIEADVSNTTLSEIYQPEISQIIKYEDRIYAKGKNALTSAFGNGETRIYHLSADGNKLVPIQDMPIIDDISIVNNLPHRKPEFTENQFVKILQERASGALQFFIQLVRMNRTQQFNLRRYGLQGPFAVNSNTYYMEYNFKLFRWEPGDTSWYDTGMEETVELNLRIARRKLKLAVSGDTVYVGKRDGHLFVSYDKGNNWIDLTPALSFTVKTFKDIIVAGSTVYVSTDAGIITSDDGRHWHPVTDGTGTKLIMERLAVDGTTLYGVTRETGFYRLKNNTWKQIIPGTLSGLTSFAVDGNTLYAGTVNNGMLFTTFLKK